MHIVKVVVQGCDKYVTRHFTTTSSQSDAARFETVDCAQRHAAEYDRRQGVDPARPVKLRRNGAARGGCRRY